MNENQLLVNPKVSGEERQIFEKLQKHFELSFGEENFFFVPSSGSSQNEGESPKLIALSREAISCSAERFNKFFNVSMDDSWGLVLPTFHVAGLSILARANLAKSRVHSADWAPNQIYDWLEKNKITLLSLVPTQVHDLVQLKIQAPSNLKKVFIGGGSLNPNLRDQFINLGWPIIETYGMTETCSMIAVKEGNRYYKLMPGIEILIEDGLLRVKCSSSAHSSIQMKNGRIEIVSFEDGWVRTSDRVKVESRNGELYLELLGREGDYVKILGEGVSLLELRDKFEKLAAQDSIKQNQAYLMAIPDMRQENKIALVVDKSVDRFTADRLVERFNQVVRSYERIHKIIKIELIPTSELGKVKANQLKEIVFKQLESEN